jgi:hypothetical protein
MPLAEPVIACVVTHSFWMTDLRVLLMLNKLPSMNSIIPRLFKLIIKQRYAVIAASAAAGDLSRDVLIKDLA